MNAASERHEFGDMRDLALGSTRVLLVGWLTGAVSEREKENSAEWITWHIYDTEDGQLLFPASWCSRLADHDPMSDHQEPESHG